MAKIHGIHVYKFIVRMVRCASQTYEYDEFNYKFLFWMTIARPNVCFLFNSYFSQFFSLFTFQISLQFKAIITVPCMLLILVVLVGAINVNRLDNNYHSNVLTRHKRASADFFSKIKSVSATILVLFVFLFAFIRHFDGQFDEILLRLCLCISFNIRSFSSIHNNVKACVRVPRSYHANN